MSQRTRRHFLLLCLSVTLAIANASTGRAQEDAAAVKQRLDKLGVRRGLCLLVGDRSALAVPLAQATELTIFVQSPDVKQLNALRKQADAAGLLGTRVYVHDDNYQRLHLAENLVDVILLDDKTAGAGGVPLPELQRVLRPGGKYLHGALEATKPMPKDADD